MSNYDTLKNNALVSVVIPCYGNLEHLSRALYSINSQTFVPYEVILINDCAGKAGNAEIYKVLIMPWPFVIHHIELKINVGAGAARNIGWDVAVGKYIAFLDADDSWMPEKLSIQVNFMERHPEVGLSGHAYTLSSYPYAIEEIKQTNVSRVLSPLEILLFNPFITPSVMIRKTIPLRFDTAQRYSEDYRLWLEVSFSGICIAKLADKLAVIHKPLLSGEGLSSNLLMMEYGEILAYLSISTSRIKYYPLILILIPYSLIKFIRRIFIRTIQKIKSMYKFFSSFEST